MKVNKLALENAFRQNVPNAKIIVLAEEPAIWKHACAYSPQKLQELQPIEFNFYGVAVKYVLCPYCGTIHYIADYTNAIDVQAIERQYNREMQQYHKMLQQQYNQAMKNNQGYY